MIIIREHINNHTSPLSNANYSLASVAFASINHHFPDLESQSSHVNQPDKHCNRTAQPDLLAAAIAPRAPRPTEIYCCLSVSSIFILQASAWAGIVGHVCIPTQTLRSILGGPDSKSCDEPIGTTVLLLRSHTKASMGGALHACYARCRP